MERIVSTKNEQLEGLAGAVITAYQTERPTLLQNLKEQYYPQTKIDTDQAETLSEAATQPFDIGVEAAVMQTVQGAIFDWLKSLKATSSADYESLLKTVIINNNTGRNDTPENNFVNSLLKGDALKEYGFDQKHEIESLAIEIRTAANQI